MQADKRLESWRETRNRLFTFPQTEAEAEAIREDWTAEHVRRLERLAQENLAEFAALPAFHQANITRTISKYASNHKESDILRRVAEEMKRRIKK